MLEREGGRRRSRGDAELGEDVLQVASDRVLADDELGGDLAVRLAGRDEAEHLQLSCAQAMRVGSRRVAEQVDAREVRRGGQALEDLTGRRELERRTLLVAESSARQSDENAHAGHLVRRVQLLP